MERLVDPGGYGRFGQPHELWTRLRRESPVRWCEVDGYPPFWAVTGYSEIRAVSVAPAIFSSRCQVVLRTERESSAQTDLIGTASRVDSVISTDPPLHRAYRSLTRDYFRPRQLRGLEPGIRQATRSLLDHAPAELDLVTDFAAWLPLRVLCSMLGVDDELGLFTLTNGFVGASDEEFTSTPGALARFLRPLLDDRRRRPRDDLSSLLATSWLTDLEALTYLLLIAIAGHDTTRSAIAGGLLALIQNPDQVDLLRARPDLCESAAEEMVRWSSPVVHFLRKAVTDTELGGQEIKRGDRVMLFYPSANRDEAVFDSPFDFRVDRHPNPHLGWGTGEHYCIGAALARLEIRILLEELIRGCGRPS